MSGAIMGMVNGIKDVLVVKEVKESGNWASVILSDSLEVVNDEVRLKASYPEMLSIPDQSNTSSTYHGIWGQRFVIPLVAGQAVPVTLTKFRFKNIQFATGGHFHSLKHFQDNAGAPDFSTMQAAAAGTVTAGSSTWLEWNMNFGVVAGTPFHLGIYNNESNTSFVIGPARNTQNPYSEGHAWRMSKAGSSYTAFSDDLVCELHYTAPGLEGIFVMSVSPEAKSWNQFLLDATTDEDSSVVVDLLDGEDQILIQNALSGASLEAVDADTIKATGIISRTTTASSPKVTSMAIEYTALSAMPVKWSSKTHLSSAPTGAHHPNTHIDIAGSGYLSAIGSNGYSIQVDGGPINVLSNPYAGLSLFPIRFNTSLIVKSDYAVGNAMRYVHVILD